MATPLRARSEPPSLRLRPHGTHNNPRLGLKGCQPTLPNEIISSIIRHRLEANNETFSLLSTADTLRLATASHLVLNVVLYEQQQQLHNIIKQMVALTDTDPQFVLHIKWDQLDMSQTDIAIEFDMYLGEDVELGSKQTLKELWVLKQHWEAVLR